MLTDAQLYHFAAHGWVLQENVFNPEEVTAFKNALDRLYETKVSTMAHKDTKDVKNIDNMVNYDQIFRNWIMNPQILPVLKQLLGTPPRFECCHAMIKLPHPDREPRNDDLRDPAKMGWHQIVQGNQKLGPPSR